jgi:hypothetical protein
MYGIHEVDAHDDEVADTLTDLHRLIFLDEAPIPEFDQGHWWFVFHQTVPVAFAAWFRRLARLTLGTSAGSVY